MQSFSANVVDSCPCVTCTGSCHPVEHIIASRKFQLGTTFQAPLFVSYAAAAIFSLGENLETPELLYRWGFEVKVLQMGEDPTHLVRLETVYETEHTFLGCAL